MLEANPNCPIRRRLAHLPWVGDNRAGLRHWLEIQRDPLAWLQKMHAMQPDVAVMRIGPQRVWCLFHPQAVHELMVEHRDDLRRWAPALCMLKQWNGRSFMMREGEPAQAQRKAVRPHIAAPAANDVRQLATQWAERIVEGREYDLDLEMAAFSATLSGHALFDVDLEPAAYRQSPRPLVELRDELCTLLMASHQSTGVTLTWCLLLLAQRPELCQRLRAELAPIDWPSIRSVSDLRNCPLLRAVLQECLRLYPPAYGLAPRQVTADIDVSGHSLKRGDVVMVSSWITHRDPRWFEAPLEFRPERFLDSGDCDGDDRSGCGTGLLGGTLGHRARRRTGATGVVLFASATGAGSFCPKSLISEFLQSPRSCIHSNPENP